MYERKITLPLTDAEWRARHGLAESIEGVKGGVKHFRRGCENFHRYERAEIMINLFQEVTT